MITIRPEQQATLLGLPQDLDGLIIHVVAEFVPPLSNAAGAIMGGQVGSASEGAPRLHPAPSTDSAA